MSDESQRIAIAAVLAGIAVAAGVLIWCLGDTVVYGAAKGTRVDAWRLLWMVPFLSAGLAFRAWKWRTFGTKLESADKKPSKTTESPWFVYFLNYPIKLAAGGVLIFAAMHSFLQLGNWLYYPTSAIVAFVLARAPGRAPLRFGGLSGTGD